MRIASPPDIDVCDGVQEDESDNRRCHLINAEGQAFRFWESDAYTRCIGLVALYNSNPMDISLSRPPISGHVIRKGQVTDERSWQESTMEELINAVWELTRLCLLWQAQGIDEPGLQRSISRVQRPQR